MLMKTDVANIDVKNKALSRKDSVRLLNAGLAELPNGEIVAHGWLDVDSMRSLSVDDYQREVLGATTSKKRGSIARALENGINLPDIMIGMRGSNYSVKGSTMTLLNDCYIVDGLQRISQIIKRAEENPDEESKLMIGAEVRFSTTKSSEKDLFIAVNTSRIPVSPNIILRNLRDKHPGVLTLYGLSHTDSKFALYEKVSWDQRMTRQELITALMLGKTAKSLHSTGGGMGGGSDRAESMANFLDNAAKRVGLTTYRRNIVEFFDIVDECFGIRTIQYKEVSPQLKGNFLVTLARVFSSHENFWTEGNKLFVDAPTKRKLAAFPIDDPSIVRLAAAGNMAQPMLFKHLVDHLNKGRKTRRLVERS